MMTPNAKNTKRKKEIITSGDKREGARKQSQRKCPNICWVENGEGENIWAEGKQEQR